METPQFANREDIQSDIDSLILILPELDEVPIAFPVLKTILVDLIAYRNMLSK